MSSNTKIIVLHLKELLYTGIFLLLAILFIVLLAIMFLPEHKKEAKNAQSESAYVPGIYTTSIQLGGSCVDVEVVVDENHINALQLHTLDEAVTTMYPLIEPSFDALAEQITQSQSLEGITYSDDTRYTSMLLLNAISQSLEKAAASAQALPENTTY